MANYTKLNMASGPRKAVLRNQVTALLWNGRIETTDAKAREVRRIAVKQYKNTVTVTKSVKDDKGNIVEKEFVNDAPEKLAVRRQMLAYLYNVKPEKLEKESKYKYNQRTGDVKYPVVEKVFREIAPKYAARAESLGQGGGYTRIIKMGPRRGDAAEMVILELV